MRSWAARRASAGGLLALSAAGAGLSSSCDDLVIDAVTTPGVGGGVGALPGDACLIDGIACDGICSGGLGCASCSTDDHCGGTEPPVCVLGSCEDCGTNAHCGAGKSCYPKDHKCKPSCAGAEDCPGGEPYCNPLTQACEGCQTGADCESEKPICHPVLKQCTECSDDAHCGAAAPVCKLAKGDCKQCLLDEHCEVGLLCHGEKCVLGCQTSDDCTAPKHSHCDPTQLLCVSCLTDEHCQEPDKPYCASNRTCAECLLDAHCPPSTPVCKGDGKCVECAEDLDCTDPVAPICEDETCIPY